jgi:hypothetical protein
MVQTILAYTFNAAAKTVTLTGYGSIDLERIHYIKNLTTGQTIFSAVDTLNYGGTVATNVLTFTASNSGMSNSDDLLIKYDPTLSLDTQIVSDGGGSLTVDGLVSSAQSGTWNINNISGTISLPTGAATATRQDTGNTSLASIDSKVPLGLTVSSTRLLVDGSGVTQPVSGSVSVSNFPSVYPINDNSGSITIDGNVGQSGTWNIGTLSTITNVVHIDDNGGSITVDGTVAATQSGAWNIGTLSTVTNVVHVDDNSSTLSIDDGAGSITIDGSVSITGALPTGSNVIGHIIADSGSTTAVTGNVTVVQSTGTNLHTVIDSGTISTVTNVVHVDDNSSTLSIDDGGGSITVDGSLTVSGTSTVTGNKTEDAASADGDAGLPILAVRKATPANTSGTDGDYEFLQVSAGKTLDFSTY